VRSEVLNFNFRINDDHLNRIFFFAPPAVKCIGESGDETSRQGYVILSAWRYTLYCIVMNRWMGPLRDRCVLHSIVLHGVNMVFDSLNPTLQNTTELLHTSPTLLIST
jgi:hypothetical protein